MKLKYHNLFILFLIFTIIFSSPNFLFSQNQIEKLPKIIGPYVQMPGQSFVNIYWAVVENVVNKGMSYEKLEYVDYIVNHQKKYIIAPMEILQNKGREFFYSIPGIGEGKIRLAPKSFNESFDFIVIGDNKSWHTNQEGSDEKYSKLLSLIQNRNPEFIVNTGDIVFEGRDYRDWFVFFRISGELMRNVPYFPTIGNHEESSDPLFKFFEFPGNKSYYSFNWGQVHFIVLNSCGLAPMVERRKYPESEWKKYLNQFEDIEKNFFNEQLA